MKAYIINPVENVSFQGLSFILGGIGKGHGAITIDRGQNIIDVVDSRNFSFEGVLTITNTNNLII